MKRYDPDERCAKCSGIMSPRWEEQHTVSEPRGTYGAFYAKCCICGWAVQRAPLDAEREKRGAS